MFNKTTEKQVAWKNPTVSTAPFKIAKVNFKCPRLVLQCTHRHSFRQIIMKFGEKEDKGLEVESTWERRSNTCCIYTHPCRATVTGYKGIMMRWNGKEKWEKTYRGSESSGCRKYLLQTSGLLWLSAAPGLARKLRLVALEIGTDGRALLGWATARAEQRRNKDILIMFICIVTLPPVIT